MFILFGLGEDINNIVIGNVSVNTNANSNVDAPIRNADYYNVRAKNYIVILLLLQLVANVDKTTQVVVM